MFIVFLYLWSVSKYPAWAMHLRFAWLKRAPALINKHRAYLCITHGSRGHAVMGFFVLDFSSAIFCAGNQVFLPAGKFKPNTITKIYPDSTALDPDYVHTCPQDPNYCRFDLRICVYHTWAYCLGVT